MNSAAAMPKKIAAKLTWTAGAAPVLLGDGEAGAVPGATLAFQSLNVAYVGADSP